MEEVTLDNCNRDCFNCPYPDCKRDERQDDRDKRLRYYYANHESEMVKRRARYRANPEKEKLYQRNYYAAHKNDPVFKEKQRIHNAQQREKRKLAEIEDN